MSKIYPTPASFTEHEDGAPFRFGAKCQITVIGAVKASVVERIRYLWHRFSFTASSAEIRVEGGEGFGIIVGERGPDVCAGDYYSIKSDAHGAALSAVSEKALIDGFSTLVQLIVPVELSEGHERLLIYPSEISDRPSIKMRSIHLCVFPETKLFTLEKAIELAGFLKFTHVVLEFWGMLKYDCEPSLSWPFAYTKRQLRPLIDLCHGFGMEVIPMINHLGHAPGARSAMGRHTVLNQNPRLQMLFEPDGWTWCTSSEAAYRLLGELRGELTELCGSGSYFHLGLDEAYSFASCPICRRRVPHELLAEYINRLTGDLAKEARRPIIWHDELIRRSDFAAKTTDPVVANGDSHNTAPALDLLDRRVIIADWQYDYKTSLNPTAEHFIGSGFDTILCPWDAQANIQGLAEAAKNLNAFGIMLTTWHHLPAFLPKMLRAANVIWQDGKSGYANAPITEAAAILRRLHSSPDFEESGWCRQEVDE